MVVAAILVLESEIKGLAAMSGTTVARIALDAVEAVMVAKAAVLNAVIRPIVSADLAGFSFVFASFNLDFGSCLPQFNCDPEIVISKEKVERIIDRLVD